MIPVLTRAQMRAFDKYAIESCHVPGIVLMENAGRGAADVISAMIEARAEGRPHSREALYRKFEDALSEASALVPLFPGLEMGLAGFYHDAGGVGGDFDA